jgi:hypothetical protein
MAARPPKRELLEEIETPSTVACTPGRLSAFGNRLERYVTLLSNTSF